MNRVLRVLSCGSEWGRAESGHGSNTVLRLQEGDQRSGLPSILPSHTLRVCGCRPGFPSWTAQPGLLSTNEFENAHVDTRADACLHGRDSVVSGAGLRTGSSYDQTHSGSVEDRRRAVERFPSTSSPSLFRPWKRCPRRWNRFFRFPVNQERLARRAGAKAA